MLVAGRYDRVGIRDKLEQSFSPVVQVCQHFHQLDTDKQRVESITTLYC